MVELVQDFATELMKYQLEPMYDKERCWCTCIDLFSRYLEKIDVKNRKYALNILQMTHSCCRYHYDKSSKVCPVKWPTRLSINDTPCYN